jgi:uncharacterized protein (DUF1919 family)
MAVSVEKAQVRVSLGNSSSRREDARTCARVADKLAKVWFRQRVRNRGFGVISNDCWGSAVYPALGSQYQTPFVGLFLVADCYLRLLEDFRQLMSLPLRFTGRSRYRNLNERRENGSLRADYPIGVLGREVELHFLHYGDEREARAKWERRKARLPADTAKLFVRFGSAFEVIDRTLVGGFDSLPYPHKVVFVGAPEPKSEWTVYMKSPDGSGRIPADMHTDALMFRNPFFDLADWLNGGNGQPKGLYRFATRTILVPEMHCAPGDIRDRP